MYDKIETIANTLVQHGKSNDRVYVMKLAGKDVPQIINYLDELSRKNAYAKICAKVPHSKLDVFLNNGYIKEASVPGFFHGRESCFFLGKFLKQERAENKNEKMQARVLEEANKWNGKGEEHKLRDYTIKIVEKENIDDMIAIYKKVFESYPFPIHNPAYLLETMENNSSIYLGVWDKNKLVALAAIELDMVNSCAEMTDFATLEEYRGKQLAYFLLKKMDEILSEKKVKTAFTIARASSFGINKIFKKREYSFGGTLINNTNIAGKIESMNVWYKNLTAI